MQKIDRLEKANDTHNMARDWRAALLTVLMALPGPCSEVARMITQFDPASMVAYIQSFGAWAPIISAPLMILQALIAPLPLPSAAIVAANAILFGWWQGALLSWFGAMIGAALCLYIARGCGQPIANRLVAKGSLERVQGFFDRYGSHTADCAPAVMPFDVMSYASSLTGMSFWPFLWATGAGQTPATLAYSDLAYALGDRLLSGTQVSMPPAFWAATAVVALLIAGLVGAQYLTRDRSCQDATSSVTCGKAL